MLSSFTPLTGFSLGPFYIYYYSLSLLGAVWVAYYFVQKKAREQVILPNKILDIFVFLLGAGIVGGRAGYVLQNIAYFRSSPLEIFALASGGLSIHGALAAGLLALFYVSKRYRIDILKLTDLFAIPLLAGQIIGRVGNYFNQELFGYPTDLPWKMFIEPARRPAGYFMDSFFHPTFAYEMILNLIGLIVLLKAKPKKTGQLTLVYLAIFSISRFITEILRISDRVFLNLSAAQLISLGLIVLSIGLWPRIKSGPAQNDAWKEMRDG